MSLMKDVMTADPKAVIPQEPKPGLIKELSVQTALKKSDMSDAGSTDVVDKAGAASDISFNLMRNTINANGQVTGSDITDYIERAEELNDEVDTIPFGLETDDGQIVKVYVNAEQADKFEETMKNMLGLEDDIEEAINRLSTEFDIVDVVWPRQENEEGEEVDPDADLSIDDTSNLEDPEDDNDFAEDEFDVIASADAKPESAPEDEEPEPEETDPDAEDEEDPDADPDADEDDEDEDPDDPDKPKKKKKKAQPAEPSTAAESKTTQEKDMTIGAKFLDRVINEAEQEDRDGVKDGFDIPLDSQARAMAARLKLPMAKRLIAFHYMCGVPGRYMNTTEVIDAVASSADMLRKKVAVRRAFLSLYEGLATAKGLTLQKDGAVQEAKSDAKRLADQNPEKIIKARAAIKAAKKALADHEKNYDGGTGARAKKLQADIDAAMGKLKKLTEEEEQINEAKAKRGSFIQKLLESVLVELGLPESLMVTTGPAVVGTGIYNTAELIEQDSTLERALRLMATRLGVSAAEAQKAVQEDVELDEAVDVGNDDYAQAVAGLVAALGIPDDILNRQRTKVVQALREKRSTLRNRTAVLTMIGRLMDIIQKNTVERGNGPANPGAANADTNEAASRWTKLSALQEAKGKPKKDEDPDGPVEAQGVKGMKSTPWKKTFKNQKAMEDWFDKNGDDITVHRYSYDKK